MDRAGRKELMFMAIMKHDRKYKGGVLSTAQMAHAAGLKSSTNVVNMLREMEEHGIIMEVKFQPLYECGYTIRGWCIPKWHQMEFPNEFIVINGEKFRRSNLELEI